MIVFKGIYFQQPSGCHIPLEACGKEQDLGVHLPTLVDLIHLLATIKLEV
jgi:hypothetical protein